MSTARVALFWIVIGGCVFAAFRFMPSLQFPFLLNAAKKSDPPVTTATVSSAAPAVARETWSDPPRPPIGVVKDRAPSAPSDIVRCGNTYGQTACDGGRTVASPAASGFDSRPSEKLAALVAQGRKADAGTTTTYSQTIDNGGASDRALACASLVAQVDAIDRTARQPLSIIDQNRLRAERQATRDRQARLHC